MRSATRRKRRTLDPVLAPIVGAGRETALDTWKSLVRESSVSVWILGRLCLDDNPALLP